MKRSLKICCGVAAVFLITCVVVFLVLFFTMLKPKQPHVDSQPVSIESLILVFSPVIELNLTLGILVNIDNRNYASFKYENSTAYVHYRGDIVAEAPIDDDTIPARKKHDIRTSLTILADKLAANPNFKGDVLSGITNFTSTTTLHGKVNLFNLFKMKGTSNCTCDISIFVGNYISIFVGNYSVDSSCRTTFSV